MTTITDIKRRNREAGLHWFDPGAMKFFLSRVERKVYKGPGGTFFVSSEQFPGDEYHGIPKGRREYHVNQAHENGSVERVKRFAGPDDLDGHFHDLEAATEAARQCAAHGPPNQTPWRPEAPPADETGRVRLTRDWWNGGRYQWRYWVDDDRLWYDLGGAYDDENEAIEWYHAEGADLLRRD